MSTREKYQRLITAFVAPELKRRGYKSSGPTFFLQRDGNWGLINFQTLTLAGADSMQFTVNLAVVSGRLWAFHYPERGAEKPAASEGDFQQRIGYLLPTGHDYWWTIDEATDVTQFGPEIKSVITDVAAPTIEGYITDSALLQLWRSGRSPGLSASLCLQNLVILSRLIGEQPIATSNEH